MASNHITYTKRNHSIKYNDSLCEQIQLKLESFAGDEDFKKIRSELFSKIASREQIKPRRLKYMYEKYLEYGSTKKKSGQKSRFLSYDGIIFDGLSTVGEKNLKQTARALATKIIRQDHPNFQCSDSYINRLIARFQKKENAKPENLTMKRNASTFSQEQEDFVFLPTMVTKATKDFEEEKGQKNDNGEGFFNFLMEEMKEENEMYQETLYLPNSQTHSIVDEEVYLTNNYQEPLVYNNLAINNFADFQEVEQKCDEFVGWNFISREEN